MSPMPEDALREPIGMERLEPVGPLAGPEERDRQAGRGADAERRAAARVAVHLRQHEAGDRQLGVERLRDADRLLAGHRVDDEQRLGGRDGAGDPHQLVHHRVVDVEAAGGVEDHDVDARAVARPRARSAPPRAPGVPTGRVWTSTPIWSPSWTSWSTAAGR